MWRISTVSNCRKVCTIIVPIVVNIEEGKDDPYTSIYQKHTKHNTEYEQVCLSCFQNNFSRIVLATVTLRKTQIYFLKPIHYTKVFFPAI